MAKVVQRFELEEGESTALVRDEKGSLVLFSAYQRLERKVKALMDRNARLRKERDELKKTIRNTAIL